MASYVVTGASRGIGVSTQGPVCRAHRVDNVIQLAFVKQLSQIPENTVFALIRSRNTIIDAAVYERPNVHVLEADITDFETLKVRSANK